MTAPWERLWTVAVGGLTDIGFSADERFVLVLGHAGRGLFDCQSGKRVARDNRDDWSFLDDTTGLAQGIGPVEGQAVRVAGLMSGQALNDEVAGWRLSRADGGVAVEDGQGLRQMVEANEEVRACGFSDTGRLLVVATASDLTVLAAQPPP